MKYLRIYADSDGASRFEDGEFVTREVELVDGAPPALFTNAFPVSEFQMFHMPPSDWEDKPHPAPRRQFVIVLAGGIEIDASDGERRRLGRGDVLLAEDTSGKGHVTRER